METMVIVALVAAVASIIAAILSFISQQRVARLTAATVREQRIEDRAMEAEKIVARFREPLLRASYDLQSRLYNLLCQGFAERYIGRGNERERSYGIENTAFLIAQYFAWVEIIRREVQFLDLGDVARTRRLAKLQDDITHLWSTDNLPALFRVFAGDQRAVGERLIYETSKSLECVGYAAFLDLLQATPDRHELLHAIRDDVARLPSASTQERRRLQVLQNALVDLLEFLDPDYVRLPRERRSKAPAAT